MKPILSLTVLLSAAAMAAQPKAAPAAQMRDAATHDQLSLKYREAQQLDPMRKLEPTKGVDPSTVNQPLDIVSQSDIISFNGMTTLVPKRAVLHIPKEMEARLKFQPGTRIVGWADFFAVNRGWITTVEVSRSQAEGNAALAEEISKRISKSSNLIVATNQAGPISVLPLKTPAVAPAATATATTVATANPVANPVATATAKK